MVEHELFIYIWISPITHFDIREVNLGSSRGGGGNHQTYNHSD